MAGKEVAEVEAKSPAVYVEPTSAAIASAFKDGSIDRLQLITPESTPEAAAAIRARIEGDRDAATGIDDLIGERETTSLKNYKGKAFQVASVSWNASDIEGEGLPFYAVLQAVTPDGEAKVLTCGARNVVQVLAIADREGWLGLGKDKPWFKAMGVRLDSGYEALELKSAAADVPF